MALKEVYDYFHSYDKQTYQDVYKRQVGYGAFKALNCFEMPETDFHEYLLSDIPHGQIHLNYYQSSQTGRTKMCYRCV